MKTSNMRIILPTSFKPLHTSSDLLDQEVGWSHRASSVSPYRPGSPPPALIGRRSNLWDESAPKRTAWRARQRQGLCARSHCKSCAADACPGTRKGKRRGKLAARPPQQRRPELLRGKTIISRREVRWASDGAATDAAHASRLKNFLFSVGACVRSFFSCRGGCPARSR
jgi:hypothetical protein